MPRKGQTELCHNFWQYLQCLSMVLQSAHHSVETIEKNSSSLKTVIAFSLSLVLRTEIVSILVDEGKITAKLKLWPRKITSAFSNSPITGLITTQNAQNELCELIMFFHSVWKDFAVFLSPNGTRKNSNNPKSVVIAVFRMCLDSTGI